jgi:hypothetical protein
MRPGVGLGGLGGSAEYRAGVRPTCIWTAHKARRSGREIGIVEGPNGNTVVMGPDIRGPADRTSTSRAEVVLELPTFLGVADIDPVLALKVDG